MHQILDQMLEGIARYAADIINFFMIEISVVIAVPKYLNLAEFSKDVRE
jgi:hypothetical protein